MFGGQELLIIAGVVVLLFGASAIPKFARSIGKAKKEFKKGMDEAEAEDEADEAPKKKKSSDDE